MRNKIKILAASLAMLASSYAVADVNIGGLVIPNGNFTSVQSIYENVNLAVGSELRGVGEVSGIDGALLSCAPGCEVTYRFGGYIVQSITATTITFTGGYVNFYLGFGAQNDFNPFGAGSTSSAQDLAAATNGTLILTLAGHPINATGATLSGTGIGIGTASAQGNSAGPLDVDMTGALFGNTAGPGAIGNGNFNSNSIAAFGSFADFVFTSSFSTLVVPHPTECAPAANGIPTGAECSFGSADTRGLVIPEPDSVALLGLGVAALALGLRRRRVAK